METSSLLEAPGGDQGSRRTKFRRRRSTVAINPRLRPFIEALAQAILKDLDENPP
jgi:hypothetical protein